MFSVAGNTGSTKTTSYKVVLPFYAYGALSFLVACFLLFFTARTSGVHYFTPHNLAIVHTMALGWGTMMILGASHQLVPVMIEGKLHSETLAYLSFAFAAVGIPVLVYGFYFFDMGPYTQWAGLLLVLAFLCYLINLAVSMVKSKHENVHAYFVFTAVLWLLTTAIVGVLMVYNFSYHVLPKNSLDYLPLHAHLGIVGWFLLLIMGIGSRLIPMFLISKYSNNRQLWWIYGLVNGGLLFFVFIFLFALSRVFLFIPVIAIGLSIALFGNFCYKSYKARIRKKVDEQMKVSLLSVLIMCLPILFLIIIVIGLMTTHYGNLNVVISYGFVIFFGWITSIILGMTFKTLPFIIWNRTYHHLAGKAKTPNPKDLFSEPVFKWMALVYVLGFVLFTAGILLGVPFILQAASALLLLSSLLYNWNVLTLFMHKSQIK
ncbi:MAG: cytochrome C oxidase subunit I [Niastella sp. SCN 39-18]|nr:cytochrome C oxidase subunit I [Sphingobacteriales bacterium]ODT53334.1 MAG: cytochrome C oxidase subunit I [Niastella sp. SCN 39-18]OJW08599.1 MAG: cytochrome C oxidase subunit I [Sphingobacteriales bacterium 39-19]